MLLLVVNPFVDALRLLAVFSDADLNDVKVEKVKFSHTRYRALGPELIPVFRQSARR